MDSIISLVIVLLLAANLVGLVILLKRKQPEQTNNEKHPFENEDEDLNMAYEEYVESLGDIPKPTHTVNENIARDTIDNMVKKAIEEL